MGLQMKLQAFLETLGLMRTWERVRNPGLGKDWSVVGLEKDLDHREPQSRGGVKSSVLTLSPQGGKKKEGWVLSSPGRAVDTLGSRVDSTRRPDGA